MGNGRNNPVMKMVFDGHPLIAGMTPGIRFIVPPLTVRQEAVFTGQIDGVDSLGPHYACVLRDGGRYRMWYLPWYKEWDGQDILRVAHAESEDGINWKRSNCGLVEYNGSKNNPLTNMPIICVNILIDPSAKSDQRYRFFGYFSPRALKGLEGNYSHLEHYDGYVTGTSADGIYWPPEKIQPLWPNNDVITGAALPEGGMLLMMKKMRWINHLYRRTFYSAIWRDGVMSEPVEALVPDAADDQIARNKQFLSADYYGVSLDPRSDGTTLGFLWNFFHQTPLCSYVPAEHQVVFGAVGQIDISLIAQFSRGGAWHHLPGRPTVLDPAQMPEWASGCICTSPNVLHVGNESRLYFSGSRDYHSWAGVAKDFVAYGKESIREGGISRIGLATWQKDRLVGLDAKLFEKVYLDIAPDKQRVLKLNVKTRPGGVVRVALLYRHVHKPIEGYTYQDCLPITGDHFDLTVRWGDKTTFTGATNPLVGIEMTNATLYAFSVV